MQKYNLITFNEKGQIVLIQDKREIKIDAPPEAVFDLIETMPNKFPVYSLLETKPFLFLREKIYWYLIKPMHLLLACKVLRVIKKKVENRENN